MTPIVLYRRLPSTARLDLSRELPQAPLAQPRLAILHGAGRNLRLHCPPGLRSLWFCLRGEVEVESEDGPFRLGARKWLALSGEREVHARCDAPAEWIAVLLSPGLHARLMTAVGEGRRQGSGLATCPMRISRELLAALGALLRAPEGSRSSQRWLSDLLRCARDQQAQELEPWLRRAHGRTHAHRRQVLLRLLRARNRILNAPYEQHAIDSLCEVSRYSKSHFIRLFRDVFGQTPHDLLTDRRIELAKCLIGRGELAIGEVACHVGFESRHAFARLFKRRVGQSATDYRRSASGMKPEQTVH